MNIINCLSTNYESFQPYFNVISFDLNLNPKYIISNLIFADAFHYDKGSPVLRPCQDVFGGMEKINRKFEYETK